MTRTGAGSLSRTSLIGGDTFGIENGTVYCGLVERTEVALARCCVMKI